MSDSELTHGEYTLQPCRTLDQLAACVDLQRQIWGYAAHEVYPLRLFVTLARAGGNVLAAYTPAREPVAFVASMPGWRGRERYFHSLSLGVLPAHENRGLGRALKLAQRQAAIEAGVSLIEWTYDPLRAKNAFFNIQRLGAIVRRYLPNHYGVVESRLQQGLPSDRVVAEWWLKSARVKRALAGKPPRKLKAKPAAKVSVPVDFGALVKSQPGEALARQAAVREELQQCLVQGLVVTGFAVEDGEGRYLLDPLAATSVRYR